MSAHAVRQASSVLSTGGLSHVVMQTCLPHLCRCLIIETCQHLSMHPTDLRPPPFSIDECLALNTKNSLSTEYFFGELIPPYIDILGRGPHFRASDQSSLKYQSIAKCYNNSQPHGSAVYMRMADYYGPQYNIQTGHPHQGYGIALLNNQIYVTAPPRGFDCSFNYFRGERNGYIDLPKARFYDPAFNCTNGVWW